METAGDGLKTQGDRLRAARRAAGFRTQRDACQRFGWNENTYRSHENGPRGISKKSALEYARVFKVSVSWLLEGREITDERRDEEATRGRSIIRGALGVRVVPVVDLSEGDAMEEDDDEKLNAIKIGDAALIESSYTPTTRATKMKDGSMTSNSVDAIPQGATIFYDPKEKARPGDQVLACIKGKPEVLVRRYTEPETGTVSLVPLNGDYPLERFPIESVRFLYPVVEVSARRLRR